MEIKDYLQIIKKHLGLFLGIVFGCIILAIVLTISRPVTYTAQTSFTASKSSISDPLEHYDEINKVCSTTQLTGSYAQTVSLWFTSAAVVKEIYQQGDLEVPNVTQDKLAKTFKAIHSLEGVIRVTVNGRNKDDLVKLLDSASIVMQGKTADFTDLDKNTYKLTEDTPIVTQDSPSLVLNILIGLIAGLILAVLTVLTLQYFKNAQQK